MTRFVSIVLLILLPMPVLTLALAALAWHTGEAMTVKAVVARQHAHSGIIYGVSRAEPAMAYKLASYHHRKPDILILGDSIMMNMRSPFFDRAPDAIYNAAVGGWTMESVQRYYQQLEEKPRIIILGLDFIWFRRQENVQSVSPKVELEFGFDWMRQAVVETAHVLLGGDLRLDQMLNKVDPVFNRETLGLKAIEDSSGYRADGSWQQGLFMASEARQARRVRDYIRLFEDGVGFLGPSNHVNESAIESVAAFLEIVKEDGITVIGISLPFHFTIMEGMQDRGNYQYMEKTVSRLDAVFAAFAYDYHFFDDLRKLGASENEWFDGHHLAESTSLRVLLFLFATYPELFEQYASTEVAQHTLDHFSNPMDVLRELSR